MDTHPDLQYDSPDISLLAIQAYQSNSAIRWLAKRSNYLDKLPVGTHEAQIIEGNIMIIQSDEVLNLSPDLTPTGHS